MDHVDQRVEKLEQEFRRSRRINRLLVLTVVAVVGIAAARPQAPGVAKPPEFQQRRPQSSDVVPPVQQPRENERLRTVAADQFVLLDRHGRSRAKLMMGDEGPTLCMFDEAGQKRVELRQAQSASGIRLFDSREDPAVALLLNQPTDHAQLEIKSPQGSSRTQASGFSVRDAADHSRLHLSLVNGNFATLGISQAGQSGPPTIEMTATNGSRSLKLHNDQGNLLFSLFAGDDHRTTLNIRHPHHERSLQISSGATDQDGPSIAFFGPKNEDETGGILPFLQMGFDHNRLPSLRIDGRDGRPRFDAPSK